MMSMDLGSSISSTMSVTVLANIHWQTSVWLNDAVAVLDFVEGNSAVRFGTCWAGDVLNFV